jgi:Cft2 family RNA processing exonuclease
VALTVKRSKGVIVEYAGQGVALDPSPTITDYPVFVTHAHADHASSFKNAGVMKYATEPTHRILESRRWKGLANWRPISVGEKVKIGDFEVRALNAGHVLGSVQYEVASPEGTVLYTGDFGLGNSYTMEPATPVECDLLVIETTFGAPQFKFPKRDEVALEMIRWAVMEAVPAGYIPVFRTDSIGNAQEIISLFNKMTNLPVITAKSATGVSDIYRQYGHALEYVDYKSSEGEELLDSGRCTVIAPKGSKLKIKNIDTALASGWAVIMKKRTRAFPLSDHADFRELLSYIRKCHPKRVLTFHGGAMTRGFSQYIIKRLGIDARPLTRREETLMGPVSKGKMRMKACADQMARSIRIPGFEYTETWLVKEMARRGFTQGETEKALSHLIKVGILESTQTGFKLV